MIEVYIEHELFKRTLATFTDRVKEFADLYLVGDTHSDGLQQSAELWELEAVEGFPEACHTDADVIFNVTDEGIDNEMCVHVGNQTVWRVSVHSSYAIDRLAKDLRQKAEPHKRAPIDNTRKESNPVEDLLTILSEQAAILKDRAKEHGTFDVFTRAAEVAGLSVSDTLKALIGVKRARLEQNPFNRDSLVDLLNYQAIQLMFDVYVMQKVGKK